jgi:hypothetical protein
MSKKYKYVYEVFYEGQQNPGTCSFNIIPTPDMIFVHPKVDKYMKVLAVTRDWNHTAISNAGTGALIAEIVPDPPGKKKKKPKKTSKENRYKR